MVSRSCQCGGHSYFNTIRHTLTPKCVLPPPVDSVQALVEYGANTNARNSLSGATPLHMVAQSRKQQATIANRIRIVELLVDHGAQLDAADQFGMTPLDTLQAVIQQKKDEADSDDNTAESLQPLLEKLKPTSASPLFDLLLAEKEGNATENSRRNEEIRQLIEERGDTILQDQLQGESPVEHLMEILLNPAKESSLASNVELLEILIAHGAELKESEGKKPRYDGLVLVNEGSPFYRLVDCVREEMVEKQIEGSSIRLPHLIRAIDLFLQGKVEIDTKTVEILHAAARRGEIDVVKLMVERCKIDPNIKGRQDMTALHFAARSGRLEVLVSCFELYFNVVCNRSEFCWWPIYLLQEFLLEQPGIQVNAQDNRGKTALDAAMVNGRSELVAILEKQV